MQLRPSFPTCLRALALWMVAGSFGGTARADLLPQCDSGSSLVTCAAADEGKGCPSGGKCYAVTCESTSATPGTTKVYRCDTCPTIVPAPDGTCTISNMGMACAHAGAGAGAVCGAIQPYCNPTTNKFVCHAPAPTGTDAGDDAAGAAGTTGAARTTGAAGTSNGAPSTSSGCDVAPRPSPASFIGLGLVAVGLLFFIIDRRRRRR